MRDCFIEEQKEYYPKFLLDALLRGDTKTRSEALAKQFQNGALNIDEWREIEDRNPLPNDEGQKFYVPLNLITTDQAQGQENEGNKQEVIKFKLDHLASWREDIAERITSAEKRSISRMEGSSGSIFESKIVSFYKKHRSYVNQVIRPYLKAVYDIPDKDNLRFYCDQIIKSQSIILQNKSWKQAMLQLDEKRFDNILKTISNF
jgi:hypothetical protein